MLFCSSRGYKKRQKALQDLQARLQALYVQLAQVHKFFNIKKLAKSITYSFFA